MDQNAKNTLEDFRQKIKLDQIWPPPITHIINFIHHMQTANYSAPQSNLIVYRHSNGNVFTVSSNNRKKCDVLTYI